MARLRMSVPVEMLPPRYGSPTCIGKGAMGEVYRADDIALDRTVAVKMLAERYADDPESAARFKREALAAARLSTDPHVVTLFDVGEWSGRPFIVMEYLAGGSVAQRLAAGLPPIGTALGWLRQAATALDSAHARGVVHRDVKPANLLLDREGELRVADFGIASAAGLDSLTATGTVLGTAGYLSPEQARGERATPASDRYALAVVAFELLTGERPFAADSPTAEANAHIHSRIPSAAARREELPAGVDEVFQRALDKEPTRRYESCVDLVEALADAIAAEAAATRVAVPATAALPARGEPRRARWGLRALVAVVALAAAAAGAVSGALLAGGNGARTAVKTVTTNGATVRETVTTTRPNPPPAPLSAPAAAAVDAHRLNDQGFARMQQGDFATALPLFRRSVARLRGAGPADPYEGYANYNLGFTLLQLGRCEEAWTYLDRADGLEPENKFVRSALKRADKCGGARSERRSRGDAPGRRSRESRNSD
jgi:tRNA A-37 threonylcarbamoyl transferase component Bud32